MLGTWGTSGPSLPAYPSQPTVVLKERRDEMPAEPGTTTGAARLRVMVVASWYPTASSPVNGIFVRDQVAALSGSMDVSVIAPDIVTWRSVAARLAGHDRSSVAPPDTVPTIRPRVLFLPRSERLNRWAYRRVLERAVRRSQRVWGRPDLINAQVVLPAGLAAARVGRQQGIPVVITEHSSRLAMHLTSPGSRSAAIDGFREATAVIAVGPGLAAAIKDLAGVPVEVIGNVVAPEFFESAQRSAQRPTDLRLLAIGLLKDQKRFDILLHALNLVAKVHKGVRLTIVGDGPEKDALTSLTRELGLADRVEFAGLATRTAIRAWMAWADALISSSDRESFGLAVAESLAAGLPVVVTASGGPEAFVEPHMGIVVPKGDADALAEAILRLPDFKRDFDRDAVREQIATEYGPEAFVSSVSPVFNRAVAATPREP